MKLTWKLRFEKCNANNFERLYKIISSICYNEYFSWKNGILLECSKESTHIWYIETVIHCLKMIRNKCMDIFIYGMPFITLIWPSQYIYSLVIANIVDKAIQVHVCRLDRYNCYKKMVLFSLFYLICLYKYFLHIGNKMNSFTKFVH